MKNNISALLVRAKIYGISEKVLRKIVARDKTCIYCRKEMKAHISSIGTPKNKKTIEHFNEIYVYGADETEAGICCGSCNASRSDNKLLHWFKSDYCKRNNISEKTVAKPVKKYIKKRGKKS